MNRLRIFVDSNIIVGAMIQGWALEKAVLSVCSAGICSLVLSEVVRLEVEEALLRRTDSLPKPDGDRIVDDYDRFITLAKAETVPPPPSESILASRHIIRHWNDVPVLVSAMRSSPDWLLTKNTDHFTDEVAKATGIRIGTPVDFFRTYLQAQS